MRPFHRRLLQFDGVVRQGLQLHRNAALAKLGGQLSGIFCAGVIGIGNDSDAIDVTRHNDASAEPAAGAQAVAS